jgi:D-alanine-D-alanine ligase
MNNKKLRVLVLFGGRSPEHDVSIITGLQTLKALDPDRYEPLPLYIAPDGTWLTGKALSERSTYIPGKTVLNNLVPVTLDLTPRKNPVLITLPRSFWQKSKAIEFDVALIAFHGLIGEDGGVQGLFEVANVPYVGMRPLASAVLMDKIATKKMLAGTSIPVLPFREIKRPSQGYLLTVEELAPLIKNAVFPCCIKPAHLGSSIGVARVNNVQEVSDVLATSIFRYDDTALLEPFVENLVEYNVAVRRSRGKVVTSAIERPKRTSELLDFKAKYMSGGGIKNGGIKNGGAKSEQISQGMLSLTREINPDIPPEFEKNIRTWAKEIFVRVGGTGAPRLDFLSNEKTKEIWFNEANPTPGSFGYFLWEAAKDKPVLFSELLDDLIEEAIMLHVRAQIPLDPTPKDARLFPRR